MRRTQVFFSLAFALLTLALLPRHNAVAAADFDRRAMLQSIVDHVIAPGQAAFIDAADNLLAATGAFLDDPEVANLEAMQAAWRNASDAWHEIAMFSLDLRITAIHNRINKPPLNKDFVADILEGAAIIDAAAVENMGSTARGMPAIAYLIFAPNESAAAIVESLANERRRDYLLALSVNLADKARELRDHWSPEGRDYGARFVNADQAAGKIQGSINMLANKLFEHMDINLQMRLGEPSGIALGEGPRPDLVESPRSQHSLAHIKHSLLGLKALFTGGVDGAAIGFDDYLDFVGAEAESGSLSDLIKARFHAALDAIDAIDLPLSRAVVEDPDTVAAAYEALRQLVIPLRADMKSQLSILITFSDRDGDQ